MAWRVANSLLVLRDQLNALYPNRSKASDGTIGDAAHQAEGAASDHNPWIVDGSGVGVVTAFDITHDPVHGLDIDALSDTLAATRDPRIKYIIANRQIMVPAENGWRWLPYAGVDPHTNHLHLSVNTTNFDDKTIWKLGGGSEMLTREQIQVEYRLVTLGETAPADHIAYWIGKDLSDYLQYLENDPSIKALQNRYKAGKQAATDLAPGLYQVK